MGCGCVHVCAQCVQVEEGGEARGMETGERGPSGWLQTALARSVEWDFHRDTLEAAHPATAHPAPAATEEP